MNGRPGTRERSAYAVGPDLPHLSYQQHLPQRMIRHLQTAPFLIDEESKGFANIHVSPMYFSMKFRYISTSPGLYRRFSSGIRKIRRISDKFIVDQRERRDEEYEIFP